MKYRKVIIGLLSVSILLSGCSFKNAASNSSKDYSADLNALSDQITQLQESLDEKESDNAVDNGSVVIPQEDMKTEVANVQGNMILTITNSSEKTYSSVTPTVIYYDSSNNMLSFSSLYMWNIFPNTTYMITAAAPTDKNYAPVEYDHYEIMYTGTIADTDLKNYADQVEITSNMGANGNVIAKCFNHSDVRLSSVDAYVIFYKEGAVVGTTQSSFGEIIPDNFTLIEFSSPYNNSNGETIAFDDYKIVVNSATVSGSNVYYP